MMKKVKLVLATILSCLFFLSINVKADTQYNTDFTNVSEWILYQGNPSGKWTNESGSFFVDGGVGNKAILSSQEFINFTYETKIKITEQFPVNGDTSSAEGGILFRVQNPSNGVDGYDGYYFGLDIAQQQVILGKSSTTGSAWTEIARKKMKLSYNHTYTLTVKVSGSHIQGYVDFNEEKNDFPKIDVVDTEFTEGAIGLRNRLAKVSFENVLVSDYDEPTFEGATYTNSILPGVADPDVLYHNGTYYLYPTTTTGEAGGIKVYTSTDLTNWTDKGLAMTANQKNWGTSGFWAPDIIERDGKFYMYYTANEHLCVAVSDSPLGPFEQEEWGPIHANTKEIDAHVFKDDDGQYYLYFVRFTNGNVIWGAKLNDDMKSIDESTLTEILVPSQAWEQDMARVNEGPYMLKKDGIYYLTYSGAHFASPMYGSGYATSNSPLGSYEKYEHNPIMQSNSVVHGTGHHGITTSPDGTEMYMVYHRHLDLDNPDPREFAIDQLRFTTDENGKTVLEAHGPTVTQQPIPSGAVDVNNFIQLSSLETKEISVTEGSDPTTWELPQTIDIVTSKSELNNDLQANISWNISEYDPTMESQIIYGTAILPDDVSNLGNLSLGVSLKITINQNTKDYQSTGTIEFVSSTDVTPPINPSNPTNPIKPVDPNNPDGPEPGTTGPLSIDFVSSLNFGKQIISSQEKIYYAQAQKFFEVSENGELIGNQKTGPNYVQVTDNRGNESGWSLKVNQDGPFKTEDGKELTGAIITLENGEVVSNSTSDLPTGQNKIVLNANGELSNVMVATTGKGTGTSLLKWGDEQTASTSISLEVPGNTTKVADKYRTKLNWTLMDVPGF